MAVVPRASAVATDPDTKLSVDAAVFQRELLVWYAAHKRPLPWRETHDAYRIWVSEIMLQQTRVAAVLEHYRRFLERFPTVFVLAEASEPEVLTAWSGLGYYRRARMMHRAAQEVVSVYGGILPATAEGLRQLAGIGSYTSAAIASIAFGQAIAVVDGNVERVLARVAGWSAAETGFAARIGALATRLLDCSQPGDYNQAMMELGATVCLPRSPLCLHCPVRALCRTRGEHIPAPRKTMRAREIAYALCTRERGGKREVLLEQRPADVSLMAGMWELPEVPVSATNEPLLSVRHAITTNNYTVRVYAATAASLGGRAAQLQRSWCGMSVLEAIPLTGLARKILRRVHMIGAGAEGRPAAPPATAQSGRLPMENT